MLSAQQYKCIELMVEDEFLQKEIAKIIDVSPETISRWKSDTEFIDEYKNIMKHAFSHIAPKARKKMIKLMDAESEQVQFNAAKDILDRAGFKPTEKVESNNKTLNENINNNIDFSHLTTDEIKELLKRED